MERKGKYRKDGREKGRKKEGKEGQEEGVRDVSN